MTRFVKFLSGVVATFEDGAPVVEPASDLPPAMSVEEHQAVLDTFLLAHGADTIRAAYTPTAQEPAITDVRRALAQLRYNVRRARLSKPLYILEPPPSHSVRHSPSCSTAKCFVHLHVAVDYICRGCEALVCPGCGGCRCEAHGK